MKQDQRDYLLHRMGRVILARALAGGAERAGSGRDGVGQTTEPGSEASRDVMPRWYGGRRGGGEWVGGANVWWRRASAPPRVGNQSGQDGREDGPEGAREPGVGGVEDEAEQGDRREADRRDRSQHRGRSDGRRHDEADGQDDL